MRTPPVVCSAPADAVSTFTSCVAIGLMLMGVEKPVDACPTVSIPLRSIIWSPVRLPWIPTLPIGLPDEDDPPTSWFVRPPRETPGIRAAMS